MGGICPSSLPVSRNEHKPWFIGWTSEVPSRRDHGTVVVLSYTDENPHMSIWGRGSLLGQDSHSCYQQDTGMSRLSDEHRPSCWHLDWDLGAKERRQPSIGLGGKGYQTQSGACYRANEMQVGLRSRGALTLYASHGF